MGWYLQRLNRPSECYELKPGATVVGRFPACEITLPHISVSRMHCRLVVDVETDEVSIEDLSSGNGVYVRGERILPGTPAKISEGATIGIGMPIDRRYPDLEESDHYRFKLIAKTKRDGRRSDPVSRFAEEIIDLTADDVRIKKEVNLDLEIPAETVEDDHESFADYYDENEPKKITHATDKIPEDRSKKSKRRASEPPTRKLDKKDDGETRRAEASGSSNLPKVVKAGDARFRPSTRKASKRTSEPPSVESRNRTSEKTRPTESPKLKNANETNVSPERRKASRLMKLKLIAEKNKLSTDAKCQSKKTIPEKSYAGAKVTFKTRGALLLENIIETRSKNLEDKKNKTSTNIIADLEDSLVLDRLLILNPKFSKINNLKDGPVTLERMPETFESYQSYKKIIENFLLFEIWNLQKAGAHHASKASKPQMKYRILQEIGAKNENNIIIMRVGPSVIDKALHTVPKYGDLLLIEFENNSCFGIVKNTLSQVKNKGIFILDLFVFCNEALLKITPKTIMYLTLKCNISYELMALYSLHRLNDVKIRDLIVSPNINHFFNMPSYKPTLACRRVLDEYQLEALKACTSSVMDNETGIQIIQGPPGTGKTLLLSFMVMEYFSNKKNLPKKILVCTQSNISADNILKKILRIQNLHNYSQNIKVLRVGRQEAVEKWAHPYCFKSPNLTTTEKQQPMSSKGISEDNKDEENNDLLKANIIVTTLLWSSKLNILKNKIDWCLIDDASLPIEVELLCPLALNIPSLVLAGDVRQQPIRLISKQSENNGFLKSLFGRIASLAFSWKQNIPLLLQLQHRMCSGIFEWPNKRMYSGKIINTKNPLYDDIPLYKVLLMPEVQDEMNANQAVAFCIGRLAWAIRKYLDSKFTDMKITVLCQNSQIKSINHLVDSLDIEKKNLVVSSIENFQGKESTVVLIAPLQNPTGREINLFFNIGLTRAKECLLVCCDENIAKTNERCQSLIQDAQSRHALSKIPHSFSTIPSVNTISNDMKFIKRLFELK